MQVLLPATQGNAPSEDARAVLGTHLGYITQHLPPDGLLFGGTPHLADVQFSCLLANLDAGGFLDDAPRLKTYWTDLQMQSGYRAAIATAGPMGPDL